jgi:TetR/AcrR family transcriptional regulator, transcriptional repressor of aconitase
MPKLSPELRTQRRRRLVQAAQRRIAAQGYHDTTIDDVCAEAGVSKGAFYGYFDTKQDMLLALLEGETEALVEVIRDLSARPLSAGDAIGQFTHTMLRVGDDPTRVQLRADLWAALSGDPVVHDRFAETVDRRRAELRGWIVAAADSGELALDPARANALASILLALTDGLMLHRALDKRGFRWANIQAVLDIMLAGLAPPLASGEELG